MQECVFCAIVGGKISSVKVFENDDILAFLDITPDTPGHTLVIPKQHAENIFDINEKVLQKIVSVAKIIALKMKESLGAKGVHLANNNGTHASQIVPHFHVHIIPRYENDGLQMYGHRNHDKKASVEDLQVIAEKLR